MEKNVIYLATGNKNIFKQVIGSIFSLKSVMKEAIKSIRIHVYTDTISYFKNWLKSFDIQYIELTPEIISQYLDGSGFQHLIKLNVIKDSLERNKSKSLFIDSDTLFKKSPDPLFDRIDQFNTVMHKKEYPLKNLAHENWPEHRKACRIYENNFFSDSDDASFQIPLDNFSWNSGVVGVCYPHIIWFDDIILLTRQILNCVSIHTAEQTALSFYFQKLSHINRADDYILHYWNKLDKYNYTHQKSKMLRKHYFNKNPKLMVKSIEKIMNRDFEMLPLPTYDPSLVKRARNKIQRLMDKYVFHV